MGASFLAILIHTPSDTAWLSSSHCCHSEGEAKGSLGSPSKFETRKTSDLQRTQF
jgi:hypothetical protein